MEKFKSFLKSLREESTKLLIEAIEKSYVVLFEGPTPISILNKDEGDYLYFMDIEEDSFIHFSKPERIQEILKAGKILLNPPFQKFGPDAVFAVSAVWGSYVRGIQLSHIYGEIHPHVTNGDIQAIYFKTDAIPKIGYPEEVLWDRDVNLINPKVLSAQDAIELLKNAPNKLPRGGNSQVVYSMPKNVWGTPLQKATVESLSTDDANNRPNGNVSNPIVPMTAPILPGTPENDEYFPETLSPEKRDLVERSKFGLGRISTYPSPGRDISPKDAGSNQVGAVQNTTGGAPS